MIGFIVFGSAKKKKKLDRRHYNLMHWKPEKNIEGKWKESIGFRVDIWF